MQPQTPSSRQDSVTAQDIPDRPAILRTLQHMGQPVDFATLAEQFKLHDSGLKSIFDKRLQAMVRDGQVICSPDQYYEPLDYDHLITGRVIGHPDGFGFLVPDDGSADLFLSSYHMRRLMHGDRAMANVTGIDKKGRREGAIIDVIEHNSEQLVGRYCRENGMGFVTPDNKRLSQAIIIPPHQTNGAKDGQIVVVQIISYPTSRSQAIGKISEILGEHLDPGMEIEIALRSHDLPFTWPSAVQTEVACIEEQIPESAKTGRLDLRALPLVTIDGEDSRDFDDAVYCTQDQDAQGQVFWRLFVAIADVSHYVKPQTALDAEALNRGTSVYFPSKVIPMLPEILSNGLCSLNPQVDRLCMVCEMRIDDNGALLDYQFHEAVMHSAARLTYTQVANMVVERQIEARKQHPDLVHHLDDLYTLYRVLRKQRRKRGAIDFETTETQILFNDDKKIDNIKPRERNDAHKIIEECMILANVCAARFLSKHKIAAPHRCHPLPKSESLRDLRAFLSTLALTLDGGDEPTPKDYAALLRSVQARPDAKLIQTALLRSLTQADYQEKGTGHFGLALDYYTHFTSPIRRYPDLLVHRAIRYQLQNKTATQADTAQHGLYSEEAMHKLCEHCSMTERRAEDASRDVLAWLKCEYMQTHLGDDFMGIISSVTNFGLFVELNDVFVEGLVHVTALPDDYYHYDNRHQALIGETKQRRFRLGDTITIRVARVDLDERKIDFVLAETLSNAQRPKRKPSKKSRRKKT
ncbi:MAG: ribonuclease R [bacterium]